MIREIHVENFKSIEKLTLELGRINVFIGANGCGKSNLLEAIAFAAAAAANKLDNEFLASRGIRVTEPRFMRSAFQEEQAKQAVQLALSDDRRRGEWVLQTDETQTYPRWMNAGLERAIRQAIQSLTSLPRDDVSKEEMAGHAAQLNEIATQTLMLALKSDWPEFLIYAPENSALRNFQAEGQILPLGGKGEGLFAHLRALGSDKNRPLLDEIIAKLSLIDWFEGFDLPAHLKVTFGEMFESGDVAPIACELSLDAAEWQGRHWIVGSVNMRELATFFGASEVYEMRKEGPRLYLHAFSNDGHRKLCEEWTMLGVAKEDIPEGWAGLPEHVQSILCHGRL